MTVRPPPWYHLPIDATSHLRGTSVTHRVRSVRARTSSQAGEGVISAAIVVLIMAIIGALMWAAFSDVWTSAEGTIAESVDEIGS